MTLQLGQLAPDFEADTTRGRIRFHDWLGSSWGVLFSHPKDFTPVCTTELGETARLKPEFDRRGVKVIGLSVDTLERHPEVDPSVTARAVYLIDPAKKVRLLLVYPPFAGRNFDEILRVIDSLQTTDRHKVGTHPRERAARRPRHRPAIRLGRGSSPALPAGL